MEPLIMKQAISLENAFYYLKILFLYFENKTGQYPVKEIRNQ
jgi:hypothetical protein